MSAKHLPLFIFSLLLSVALLNASSPLFLSEGGQYSFYIYSKSSSASVVTVSANVAEKTAKGLNCVRGESIFFSDAEQGRKYALQQIEKYGAVKIACERVGEIVCDYYYSPQISNYVFIGLKRVNLHVISSPNGITLASPLAFDGF